MNPSILDKFEAVQKSKTYQIVLEQIRALIISGDILPGEKLPSERELSRKLNVSRASVRIALKLLEFMNLVEVRPGSGIFVAEPHSDQGLGGDFDRLGISQQHPILDLLETRKDIEPYMAALAAERATEKDILSMEAALADMESAVQKGAHWVNKANIFHILIARATHNIILYRIALLLQDLMKESKEISLKQKSRAERSFREHLAILEAIKNHDTVSAREKMLLHLQEVDYYLTSLRPQK